MKRFLAFLLVAALISALGCSNTESIPDTNEPMETKETTDVVPTPQSENDGEAEAQPGSGPEFAEFNAHDLDGNEVDQSIVVGNTLTLINIWTTFCGPCISEMPYLGELSEKYADKGVVIIGICTDVTDYNGNVMEPTLDSARQIIEETGANYLHLMPSDDLNRIYLQNVMYVPETVLLGSDGSILDSFVGSMEKADWQSYIDGWLEKVNG